MPRTIAVIDGNSLMHRAYHAVPPTMNAPDGTHTNAVFGFLSMLFKFIDTAKPAEDGSGDVILRLYESKRGDTACNLSVDLPVQAAWLCDMLENKLEALPISDGEIALRFHPFEVKTIRLILAAE